MRLCPLLFTATDEKREKNREVRYLLFRLFSILIKLNVE